MFLLIPCFLRSSEKILSPQSLHYTVSIHSPLQGHPCLYIYLYFGVIFLRDYLHSCQIALRLRALLCILHTQYLSIL